MTEYPLFQEGFEDDLAIGETSRIFGLSVPVNPQRPYPTYWYVKRAAAVENGYCWVLHDSNGVCIRRGWADSLKAAKIAVEGWATDDNPSV